MDDLVAFLRARLDEDEKWAQIAKEVADASGKVFAFALQPDAPMMPTPDDPGRMLREVAFKRAILELHSETHECPSEYDNCGWFEFENGAICPTLRHAAAVYSDYPGYRPEWAPTQS